jgi:sigma-B regulation protein RsbU (phosphoserine phosphatase)
VLAVRDIMVADPLVVAPATSVQDAARLMHERNINSVVIGEGERVEGIFTSRDLLRQASSGRALDGMLVSELMTPGPTTINASSPLELAMEVMDRLHVRHLPVVDDGRLVGILSVRDLMRYRAEHLEDLVQRQTAELQTKHRSLEYHLELAGRIQEDLLPAALPQESPLSVAALYHPLHHVSGDTYDVQMLTPDRMGILIADARGHGVPAAFVSVMARMVFQAFGRAGDSPASVLRTMNERLPPLIQAEHFITMCYAVVDRGSLRMTYAAAGHPPPLWYRRASADVQRLDARGDLIGVMDDPVFEERTVQLRHRDAVVFYTDGLIESRNEQNEVFGEGRIAELLTARPKTTSVELLDDLDNRLSSFCRTTDLGDDVTCIALRIA